MKKEATNKAEIAAVYNYLQMLLSFRKESIEETGKSNKSLCRLKLSKLKPKYTETDESSETINTKIKLTTKKINKKIKQYQAHKTIIQREQIMNELKRLYEEVLEVLSSRNENIISSIRNSVEHGNITPHDDTIELINRTNPLDKSICTFTCQGTPKDFIEIFKRLELENKNDDFTFNDFMEEIEYILKDKHPQTYNNFVILIEAIRKINEDALLDVLKGKLTK